MGKNVGGGGLGGGGAGGGAGSGAGNVGGGASKTNGGKSNASGGNSSASGGAPKGPKAAPAPAPQNTVGDPISANPNNPRTQNIERAGTNYTGPGATPAVADPSLGQILGSILSAAPVAGTLNNALGVANNLADGSANFKSAYDGGAFGQELDKLRGVSPGPVTGATNPDAGQGQGNTRGNNGALILPVGTQGRVVNGADTPVASSLKSVLSAAGTWPPVKAGAQAVT